MRKPLPGALVLPLLLFSSSSSAGNCVVALAVNFPCTMLKAAPSSVIGSFLEISATDFLVEPSSSTKRSSPPNNFVLPCGFFIFVLAQLPQAKRVEGNLAEHFEMRFDLHARVTKDLAQSLQSSSKVQAHSR